MLRYSKYLLAILPGLLALGALAANHPLLIWFYPIFALVVLPVSEWLMQDDNTINPEKTTSGVPTLILVFASMLHWALISLLVYKSLTNSIAPNIVVPAVIGTGLHAGIIGITIGHELVHRKEKYLRAIGIMNLFLVNYTHFYIEHVKGHHKNVGTRKDPATARKNESLYAFFARSIMGQIISAWQLEQERLHQK
jgi:alkane 1-monooxygenase